MMLPKQKRVKDLMIQHPIFISSDMSLKGAAIKMKIAACGVLLVGAVDNVEGIITDRDLVIRALSNGDHGKKPVGAYMTRHIIYCDERDTLKKAANVMQDRMINRLVVKNRHGLVSGILSFGDILRYNAKGKDVAKIVEKCMDQKAM